ncbi:MAG: ABC transporter ATP-binding protein [Candidatus Asgardarchaeia archaeon]
MKQVVVENLTKIYTVGKGKIYAVNNVNFTIEKGEFIILFGPSGSGKTTLLMLLGALIKPTSGTILYDSTDITKFSEDSAAAWRQKNLGFVFQKINLIDFLNAIDNVLLPIYPLDVDIKSFEEKARKLLERVGLANRINHKPAQLSVGEQQRVAIARALINDPQIVLADEPTAHLDSETGKKIIELMKELNDEMNVTFVVSTHDPDIISVADRVIKIRDGKIVEITTP